MEKGIRYEKFKDEAVRTLLKSKDSILKEGHDLVKEHEKIEQELEKKNQQIQKIKDKVKPMVDPFIEKMNLGEFEMPSEVTVEGGDIKVQIIDQLEAYKNLLRKKKEDESKANSDSTDKPSKETK